MVISIETNEKVLKILKKRAEKGWKTRATDIESECNIGKTWTWSVASNLHERQLIDKGMKDKKTYHFEITKKGQIYLQLYEFKRFLCEILEDDTVEQSKFTDKKGEIDVLSLWNLFSETH